MNYAYRMKAKESYWKGVPKGLVIECVSDWGPNMGGPNPKSTCRVLNMMGINVEENDSCCFPSFWDWTEIH